MGVLLRKAAPGVLAAILLLAEPLSVYAGNFSFAPLYQVPEEPDRYVALEEESGEYEVQAGDTLWKIAGQLLGNGEEYGQLVEMNPDVIADPDLIYPHTCLRVRRNVYVRKGEDNTGNQIGPGRFGSLMGWSAGFAESGEAYASLMFTDSESRRVACRIVDKEQVSVDTLSDWDWCREAIMDYAEKKYGDQVSDLTFERYRSENGVEIYLYSYVYTVSGEEYGLKGSLAVYVSHAVCLAESIQGEFVGFHTEEGIEDVVRYLAAGFDEMPDAGSDKYLKMNAYNVFMGPMIEWKLRGVCNSFGWMKEYFDGIFTPEDSGNRSAKDRIIHYRAQ